MSDNCIVVDEADMLLQRAFFKDVEDVLNQLGMKLFEARPYSPVRARHANWLVFVGATSPYSVDTTDWSVVGWMI